LFYLRFLCNWLNSDLYQIGGLNAASTFKAVKYTKLKLERTT